MTRGNAAQIDCGGQETPLLPESVSLGVSPVRGGISACSAVLTFDGIVTPFTRVLAHERSERAARYRACKLAMGLTWKAQWAGRPLLGKGLAVTLDMVIVVPVDRLWRQDASNLGKSVEDSMLGVVLVDDRYVVKFTARKEPARPILGIEPGAWVEVTWRGDAET